MSGLHMVLMILLFDHDQKVEHRSAITACVIFLCLFRISVNLLMTLLLVNLLQTNSNAYLD